MVKRVKIFTGSQVHGHRTVGVGCRLWKRYTSAVFVFCFYCDKTIRPSTLCERCAYSVSRAVQCLFFATGTTLCWWLTLWLPWVASLCSWISGVRGLIIDYLGSCILLEPRVLIKAYRCMTFITHTHMIAHTHTHLYMCTCTHTHTHTHTDAYACTPKHTLYTHTHTLYTHTDTPQMHALLVICWWERELTASMRCVPEITACMMCVRNCLGMTF